MGPKTATGDVIDTDTVEGSAASSAGGLGILEGINSTLAGDPGGGSPPLIPTEDTANEHKPESHFPFIHRGTRKYNYNISIRNCNAY